MIEESLEWIGSTSFEKRAVVLSSEGRLAKLDGSFVKYMFHGENRNKDVIFTNLLGMKYKRVLVISWNQSLLKKSYNLLREGDKKFESVGYRVIDGCKSM